jgi:hypothetical protein
MSQLQVNKIVRASSWRYHPSTIKLKNMDEVHVIIILIPTKNKIQESLDKRLSPTAQFEFASFFHEKIRTDNEKFLFPMGAKDLHWKDLCKLTLYRYLYPISLRRLAEIVYGDEKKQSTLG